MKKLVIGILIPVIIIVGGAATLYFLISDSSNQQYQKTDKTTEVLMNEKMLMAFSDTKTSHHINFSLEQDDFNQAISLAYDKLDDSTKEYLKGAEIKIDGDVYHIYVYAQASIVKSKIDLSCKFSSDDENYYLKIDSLKVGKLSGMKWLATSILKNAISDDSLNSSFASAGIHMKADLNNDRFVYKKEDCKSDIISLMKKQMTDSSLSTSLVSSFLNMDLLSVDFTSKLQAIIDLEPLNKNEAFCHSDNMIDASKLNLDAQRDKVKTLLENGKIDLESSHPTTVFFYLLRGYEALDDSQKQYIDSIDLTSIGIKEVEKKIYAGYHPTSSDIKEVIQSSTLDGTLISSDGLLIKEELLNSYLQSQDILGYSYIIAGKKDNSYIVNYITVDNLYFDCLNSTSENMNMVIGMNVNGYETSLILENKKEKSLDYGLTLKNEQIYFGEKEVDDDLKTELYKLIKDNLPSSEFLTFDGNGTFSVNFEVYLSDYISLTGGKLALETTVVGDSLTDKNAGIRLKGKLA